MIEFVPHATVVVTVVVIAPPKRNLSIRTPSLFKNEVRMARLAPLSCCIAQPGGFLGGHSASTRGTICLSVCLSACTVHWAPVCRSGSGIALPHVISASVHCCCCCNAALPHLRGAACLAAAEACFCTSNVALQANSDASHLSESKACSQAAGHHCLSSHPNKLQRKAPTAQWIRQRPLLRRARDARLCPVPQKQSLVPSSTTARKRAQSEQRSRRWATHNPRLQLGLMAAQPLAPPVAPPNKSDPKLWARGSAGCATGATRAASHRLAQGRFQQGRLLQQTPPHCASLGPAICAPTRTALSQQQLLRLFA
jgi:hypothetical protein